MEIIETIKMLAIEEATEKRTSSRHQAIMAKKFTITEIANYANVDEEFVMEVKKDLNFD